MADPTQLPPHFVGRYPGAPIPVPLPVVPNVFASRQDFNAHGTTSGAVPVFAPLQQALPAPAVVPLDTAALNAATQGPPPVIQPANPDSVPPAAGTNAVSPTPGEGNPLPASMRAGLPLDTAALNAATQGVPLPAPQAPAAGAVAPYDPEAVGSWQTYQRTQDHTLFDPFGRGDGTPGSELGALPGGGAVVNGHFVDPRDAIAEGYRQQLAYQKASMNNLLAAGGSGGALGFHARMAALAATIGQNNFGGVQGQGVDALNQSIAHVAGAGITADAQRNAQEQETARQQALLAQKESEFQRTPLATGQNIDMSAGYPVTSTTYAQPGARPAGMVKVGPAGAQEEARKFVPGNIYTDKAGNRRVYQADGTWKKAE